MQIKTFFDPNTSTLTYVLHQKGAKEAIVIDPVWDLDVNSGTLRDTSVQKILDYLSAEKLTPVLCIETHAHADHITGSQILKKSFPQMDIAVNSRIKQVQEIFFKAFNLNEKSDGSQFDRLFEDGETCTLAGLNIEVLPTPGHTPACTSYFIEGSLFAGDSIFMPDYGTGRCDFPAGSAETLYHSIHKTIYSLPDETPIYVGHDYQPNGRELKFQTTVGEEKKHNIHLRADTSEAEFVKMRQERDKTLAAPRLLLPSIQVNISAGHLPAPEENGVRYLKLPLKT